MYNIWDGRGFGLHQAIRDLYIGKYDLILLTGTNIPDADYCHNSLGYDCFCSQTVGTTDR